MRVTVGPKARWAPEQFEHTNTPKSNEAPKFKNAITSRSMTSAVSTVLVRISPQNSFEDFLLFFEAQHCFLEVLNILLTNADKYT